MVKFNTQRNYAERQRLEGEKKILLFHWKKRKDIYLGLSEFTSHNKLFLFMTD